MVLSDFAQKRFESIPTTYLPQKRGRINLGKYVFAQIIALAYPREFVNCVDRYQGDYRTRNLKCWQQFLGLSFGQLTHRESLRNLVSCMEAHQPKLYHLDGLAFDNRIYALDSSTIDLCLEVFWWAKFRKHKAATKIHTLLNIRCQILQSMNETLQILSTSVFDKTPENQLFTKIGLQNLDTQFSNQLNMFDL